jgi:hypothetical protein
MGMRRTQRAGGARPRDRHDSQAPIPLDAVSLLAGIAPGLELDATVSPDGRLGPVETVSVEEVGRLLRCSEATVRRLIRTAVLRPVGIGERQVRRTDVESYRQSLHRRAPGKPGE